MSENSRKPSRRTVVIGTAAAGGLAVVPLGSSMAQAPRAATPACGDADEITPRQTEGPYFRPRAPARSDLVEPGMPGRVLSVAGTVMTRRCHPVPRALIEVWQADDAGRYDNAGFRLRGHLFADADGRYRFRTVVPGLYPGRTRHIHVKVQAPNGPLLTTQLYFPDEPRNRRDGLFDPALLLALSEAGDGLAGRFDFVLDIG
jgi:protocatechuate 3,4-dioxygenase beta subunit